MDEKKTELKIKPFQQFDKRTYVEHGLDKDAQKAINGLKTAINLHSLILVAIILLIVGLIFLGVISLGNVDQWIKDITDYIASAAGGA